MKQLLAALLLISNSFHAAKGLLHSLVEISDCKAEVSPGRDIDLPAAPFHLAWNSEDSSVTTSLERQCLHNHRADGSQTPQDDGVAFTSASSFLAVGTRRQGRFDAHETQPRVHLELDTGPGQISSRGRLSDSVDYHTKPQLLPSPVDHEPRPHKLIKLMGTFMGPQLRPGSFDNHGVVKQDSANKDAVPLTSSRLDSTSSSSMSTIAQEPSFKTKESAEMISNRHQGAETELHSQDEINRQRDLFKVRLKFDKELFAISTTFKRKEDNLRKFIGTFEKLSGDELVMTELQFMSLHKIFSNRLRALADDTQTKRPLQKKKNPIGDRKKNLGKAKATLIKNKKHWYKHWNEQATFESGPFDLQLRKVKPHKTREMIMTYLFYVEMISTIVPGSKTDDTVGSRLKEAFELAQKLLISLSSNKKEERSGFKETKLLLQDRLSVNGYPNFFSCVWIFLEFWMDTHRKELFEAILQDHDSPQTVKTFFNKIFYYTIGKLSSRLHH
ncbi:hypothetical protein Pst134EB_008038 [Puccinia striiformis f. sp. tritici]|nr:hypothetical protein Pst134EB_008038 [Puccinia striiformis f. sp. tritici]